MKKITLLILLLFSIIVQAQVINQPANWPNTNWTVTGTYNTDPAAFEADPTTTANFAFDDDDAGSGSTDAIQAESPVIDLTAAFSAGETWLFVDTDYVFNWISSDAIGVEYWDADAGTWNPWGSPIQADTATPPTNDFCAGTSEAYTTDQLNIAGFTATQLSGFKYRLFYDDGGIWGWGMCFSSPTLYSQMPPACADVTGITAVTTGDTTADITWLAGGSETEWQIWVQPAGTGEPTTDGTTTSTNNPYPASGLTPSTAYEVYVRANCNADGFSNWVGPVNFTTFNTPPPAPVGVTCSSGTSTFIFTEDFGNDTNYVPTGWTGSAFADGNGNWDITTPNGNSGGTGPNITWDGNAGTHLEYEASGDATNIASAITPAIDLSTAVDGAELSFYMHAFGADMGTLNIGVSTSATGPFTTEYTWIGDYQATADEAWVPIGVNLDAYLGQVIYIEFSYGGAGTGFEGDMSIDQVRVETCGNFCVAPTGLAVANVTDTTADISWTANNGETAWEVVVQAAGTGIPTGSGTPVTTNPYTATGLNSSTVYEVYILADCGSGTSVWAGPINFTTLNTPPPPPVGVTCSSGGSTFVFTETFGTTSGAAPAGWTGTGFGGANGNWRITNPNANSFGTGPNVSWDGNAGVHLEYEASGSATAIASAISPAIDLSPAVDGAELSFYMHAFGADMGTLNVGVSTSPTGPFTTEYTWIGDYQTTADEAWVPIGINLDAYLGQVIYIEFSYGGAGTGFEGDMSIDQIQVETCGTFCIAPNNLTASNITATSADIAWTPSGPETQWNYVVQPAGTGTPTSGTTVGTTTVSESGLTPQTDYEVYVQAICGADTSVWAGPIFFSTPVQTNFVLDCVNGGPQTLTYCYVNNDPNVFTFTSADGTTPLNITFNAGEVEQGWDELVVFDSDGTTDLNAATPYGNGGDVSGLQYQSTGSSIAFQVQADGIFDCGSQGYTSITVTVSCATCIYQTVDFTTVTDCSNGNSQFFIDVNVTDAGDSNSLTITDDQGSAPVVVSGTGITQVGPYPLGTDVVVTVANTDDNNCVVTSSTLNVPVCPPANDECSNAIVVTPNPDENCTNITSASLYGATTSSQANTCPGTANDDVWFQFTATATDHGIDITNIVGDTTNLNHGLFEGTDCNNLTNLYCEAGNSSIANGLTVGNTYYIRIYTDGSTPFQDVSFDLCVFTIPPPIITNDTQYTVPELVTDVLVNSPCAIVNNVTWSSGADFGTDNGIGYFDGNGSSFPFQSGIVLTTGNVNDVPGPETGTQSGGGFGWPGDADLEAEINEGTTNNASIIEFDFTPLIDQMSFNFIFASEEYGTFQCGFSDAFVFLLTDLTTGVTTNLAVVPGTTTPVSVFTIRDNQYNGGCPSSNPTLFDFYSDVFDYPAVGSNPIASPIDFRGRTVPLTASSPVTPNNPYHIKLVIADDGDTAFDSAVFLEASSFDIGTIDLGNDILVSNGTASCEGDDVVLDLGIAPPTNATITWYTVANGITEPIPGENGTSLTVSEEGVYQVDITFAGVSAACFYSDDIVVEFFPNPEVEIGDIPTITACDTDDSGITTFDLTENEAAIIGTQTDTSIAYYETEQDAIDETNPITNPTSYTSAPTTVYIRLTNDITGCYRVESFDIDLAPKPILGDPVTVTACDSNDNGIAIYDLTENETLLADGQTGLTFSYYLDSTDAATSTNNITNSTAYETAVTTIYVRVENADGCFEVAMFDLDLAPKPVLGMPEDLLGCDNNDDGIAEYDLTLNEGLLANDQALTFSYYLNDIDATTSTNALSNVTNYESGATTIYVRAENAEGCFEVTTFDLFFGIQPETIFDTDVVYEVCPNATVPITVTATPDNYTADEVSIVWYDQNDNIIPGENSLDLDTVLTEGVYTIEVTFNDTGCSNTATVDVYELDSCIIPQGISPNNDGLNDNFDLSSFDVQRLEIYNRYGTLVYSKDTYSNEWHGQSNDGDELPVGTYYFVMKYQGTKQKAAWVYINR